MPDRRGQERVSLLPSYKPFPFIIEPPIKLRTGEIVELPKQLFPFTECVLKFELYRKLQEMGVKAYLDPKIPIESTWKQLATVAKKHLTISYVKRTRSRYPDILIPSFIEVWEVKSGLISVDLQQAVDYPYITGMSAYTIAWECSYLNEFMKYGLVLANPLTEELKASDRFFSLQPSDSKLSELELKSDYHKYIQYELYKMLRESKRVTTAEVEYGPNIIFAPDEITMSEIDGIMDFKPVKRVRRLGRIDVLSKPKDEAAIDGYEVEVEKLDPEQWHKMINSRVLDRFWIVIPR